MYIIPILYIMLENIVSLILAVTDCTKSFSVSYIVGVLFDLDTLRSTRPGLPVYLSVLNYA